MSALLWLVRAYFAAAVGLDLVTTQLAINNGTYQEGGFLKFLGQTGVVWKSLVITAIAPVLFEVALWYYGAENGKYVAIAYVVLGTLRLGMGIRNIVVMKRGQ